MDVLRRPAAQEALWVLGLALALFVVPLALDIPLLDPDEGLHASIAQEMVERGDWVTPRLEGQPFLDKPVLFFWAQAISLSVFGMNEAAIRLPGLAFGLLGAWATARLARRWGGQRDAMLAGVFQMTMVLPLALSQAAVHDVALVPWVVLALSALWSAAEAENRRAQVRSTFAAGLWLGLAILTKGLIGVATIGLAYVVGLALERRFHPRLVVSLAAAGALGLVLASPWYLLMEQRNPGYLYYYFIERHLLGYVTSTQRHSGRPWWYYLPLLAGGGAPWVFFLPVHLRERLMARAGLAPATTDVARRAAVWLATTLLFLSAAGSKLVSYLLPAFPAVALLAADLWARALDGRLAPRLRAGLGHVLLASALFVPLAVPVALRVSGRLFQVDYSAPVWIMGIAMACLAAAPLWAWRRGQPRRAVALSSAALALLFLFMMSTVVPRLAPALSSRDLAAELNRLPRLPGEVLVIEERIGSLVFYLRPELRRDCRPGQVRMVMWHELDQLETLPDDAWLLLPEKRVRRASERFELAAARWQRVGHYRRFSKAELLASRHETPRREPLSVGARPTR